MRGFQFSVRDVMWLTMVVAVGLGWFLQHRDFRADLDRANNRVSKLEGIAGAMEHMLTEFGWKATWDDHTVRFTYENDPPWLPREVPLNTYKPSVPDQ